MAELTNLETKLGECLGLAMAAQGTTEKVLKLVQEEGDEELAGTLRRMHDEAAETERRCTEFAGTLAGKKSAILDEAREVKQKATEMMSDYLTDGVDALDGFEFLTMAEAGETGHWTIVATMNERAGVPGLQEVVDWVTPIQRRHFDAALEGSVALARQEDPNAVE